MDLHKAFVSAVIASGVEGYKSAQSKGVISEFLGAPARDAWDFVVEFYGKHKDLPSVEVISGKTGVSLPKDPPKEPVDFFIDEVLNLRLHAQVGQKLEAVAGLLTARRPQEAYEAYSAGLRDIRKEGIAVSKTLSLPSLGPDFLDYYELVKSGHRGVETPWPTVNDSTMGFWPEDFVLYVARLGVGKTWTLVQVMLHAWFHQKKRVLFVTTEMSREKILQRTYALHFKLPYEELRRGRLSEFAEKRFREGVMEMKDMDGLYIVGGGFDFTMDSLEAAIEESEPDLCVVDGAYLIKTSGDGRMERAANSFDELKRCAKRNKIPIVASTQFNREAKTNSSDSVSVEKIALSDAAGWNADLIFGLVQTDEMRAAGRMIQKPLKFREGVGEDVICNWDFKMMDFSEIPKDVDVTTSSSTTPVRKDSASGLLFSGDDADDDGDAVPF